ncbi:MAG: polysaccharide deacetylase family protein [Acidaminococcaceae bacterium]|nr:polysaccharide deacetylase family protein [Acidaminococcaceae bacterium]
MHLKKHLMFIFAALCVLGLIYFYALSDLFHPKQIASYENFTEMSEEFDASGEIAEAAKKFPETRVPADIIKGSDKAAGNLIALTFDGMDNRGNMEAVLKIITDEGWHATFFVEGVNAARNATVIKNLAEEDQLVGNYSFVGISKAERMEPEALFEQFCRTQKILKLVGGIEPKLFKLHDTRYMDELLRAAKACGLDHAVQSDLSVPVRSLADNAALSAFVEKIRPGMIVSLQMGRPVPIRFTQKKGPDVPAIDKKPSIQDKNVIPIKEITTPEIVKQLCVLLKAKGFRVVTVNMLHTNTEVIQKAEAKKN